MNRASILRSSPLLLLLAAALVGLAVFLVHDARPAAAHHVGSYETIWSATLTVQDIDGTFFGCDNIVTGKECSSTRRTLGRRFHLRRHGL